MNIIRGSLPPDAARLEQHYLEQIERIYRRAREEAQPWINRMADLDAFRGPAVYVLDEPEQAAMADFLKGAGR